MVYMPIDEVYKIQLAFTPFCIHRINETRNTPGVGIKQEVTKTKIAMQEDRLSLTGTKNLVAMLEGVIHKGKYLRTKIGASLLRVNDYLICISNTLTVILPPAAIKWAIKRAIALWMRNGMHLQQKIHGLALEGLAQYMRKLLWSWTGLSRKPLHNKSRVWLRFWQTRVDLGY